MKKLVTILLVAMLAVSCVFALAACDGKFSEEVLADADHEYTITGEWNGWRPNFDKDDSTKLDAKYMMKAVSLTDEIFTSSKAAKKVRKDLRDSNGGAKFVYVIEYTFVNEGATWDIKYATSEGAEVQTWNGNMAIKVLRNTYNTAAQDWTQDWLPNAGDTNLRSITPDTLYMPPHSEAELWENSGAWNNNPVVLEAGTYYIVFAAFTDGTFGLGAIAK